MADVKFEVAQFDLANTSGNQDIILAGFGTPKAVIFIVNTSNVLDTPSSSWYNSFGFTDGTNQTVTGMSARNGASTSDTARVSSNAKCISFVSFSTGLPIIEAEVVSFGVDKVTINNTLPGGTVRKAFAIFIGGADVSNAHVGSSQLSADFEASEITTVGFESDLVFMTTSGNAAGPAASGLAALNSFGVGINAVGDPQRSSQMSSKDNSQAAEPAGTIRNDAIVGRTYGDANSWNGVIGNYNASGFRITPDANPNSDHIFYLCLKFTNSPDLALFDVTIPTTGDYIETSPGFTPSFGLISAMQAPSTRNAVSTTDGHSSSLIAFDDTNVAAQSWTELDFSDPMSSRSFADYAFNILAKDGSTRLATGSSQTFTALGWDVPLTTHPPLALLSWALAVGPAAAGPPADIDLEAAPGVFTIQGNAATLPSTDIDITAAAGVFTMQGHEAALLIGAAPSIATLSLAAAKGSFTIAGWPATLSSVIPDPIAITAGIGSFNIRGFSADIDQSSSTLVLSAQLGLFTLQGHTASVIIQASGPVSPVLVPPIPAFPDVCGVDRIKDIFLRARDTLNDHNKDRWSDATLMRNLNQGIEDIALQTELFKNSSAIALVNGQEVYNLPCSLLRVKHCTYDWKPLPLRSSGWMSANSETDWRYRTSSNGITAAVFDEVSRRQIRVYPRPFGNYGVEYSAEDGAYGVTVGISDYEFIDDYGVVGTLADPDVNAELQNSTYGVLSSIGEAQAFVVYYTECPPLPESVDDDLPIDSCFDTILKHYVVAMALRNDLDAQNRSMANEELVFYQRGLDVIKDIAVTDSVSAPWFESHYNPMG